MHLNGDQIRINRILEEEIRQNLFIHKLLRSFELKGIKKNFITLLVLSAILTAFSFFTDLDFLIGFYIVITGTWTLFLVRYFIKARAFNLKQQQLKQKCAEKFNLNDEIFLEFNNEWVKYTTPKTKSEIKWEYFRAYLEEADTIYLLLEQVNSTWSFSRNEIGHDGLSNLKRIAKAKLTYLKY
ncbi:hypothetical protein [Adhaeribacter radiodurans]|uniref:YcxB family protein n=1 Tax=Adhaeribacter radiodurans TaxID=2745197 RepID=A0A7L7LFQ9_9BACT|nr:hypothetical protein [Adhaeribacter radiodurans]QMU31355.1 hypothetical protein HUW48_26470 [Adhaeribacter radiodurans]